MARSRSPRRVSQRLSTFLPSYAATITTPPYEVTWTGVYIGARGALWFLQDVETRRTPLGILQVREKWVRVLPPPSSGKL